MSISVLTAANKGYQSGNPTVAIGPISVPAKSTAVVIAGSVFLGASDATWAPTITDGSRTWTLRARNLTDRGCVWVYDWYNTSTSSASISFTINFPAGVNNMSTGWTVLAVPGEDPATLEPTIVKNPTGDTITTPSAAFETADIIVGHNDETILAFASNITTLPTVGAGTTNSTSAPVSVIAHVGEGSYGAMWRTSPGPAAGVPVTVGATAPSNSFAGCIAISYKALPSSGSPPASATTPAWLGWFTPLGLAKSWFDTDMSLEGWGDEEDIVEPVAGGLSAPATVAETATITAAGVMAASQSATVTETVTITAAGVVARSTSATVTETATLTASGALGKSADATVAETAVVTAAGQVATLAAATVSETVTITAAGSVTSGVTASATVTQTATITATGVVGRSATATITETVTLTGAGTLGKVATATVTQTVTLTADGVVAVTSDAPVAQTVTITTTGTVDTSTGAVVAQTVTVTAAGLVEEVNPPTIVPARILAATAWVPGVEATARTTVIEGTARTAHLTATASTAVINAQARTIHITATAR